MASSPEVGTRCPKGAPAPGGQPSRILATILQLVDHAGEKLAQRRELLPLGELGLKLLLELPRRCAVP